jgi:two-component system response regulator (stage 0 sporulation protein A)
MKNYKKYGITINGVWYPLETLEDGIALTVEEENNELLKRISKVLKDLGMPVHLKGYGYVRTAILMVYNDFSLLGDIVNSLYGDIARQYHTTSGNVERAFRYAILVSWERCNTTYANKLFGHTVSYKKTKPTAGEFIAKLSNELRLGNI